MFFKKIFFGLSFIFVTSFVISAQVSELVQNGNFSNGSTNWYLGQYGGSSSGSVINGEYKILVSSAGTAYWHVQFQQGGIPLEEGKQYIFRFDAYKGAENSGSQTMQVNIGQNGGSYLSYFGGQNQTVTLSTIKTTYTFTMTMTHPSDPAARIEFNCGMSTGGFVFDNVSLSERVSESPLLTANPMSINFGRVLTGASPKISVKLQNASMAITTINAVQSSSGNFTPLLTVPASVPASGSITLPIEFSTVTAGSHTASITIYSNATDNPTINLAVQGVAVLPGVEINPLSLSFSTTPNIPASQNLTISNTSTTPITWNIAGNVPWAIASPTSGTILAGGEAVCTITASVSSTGNYSGELTLTHSATNQLSPITIPLSLQAVSGYQPTNQYILNPQLAIDFIKDIASFRKRARDDVNGGFYTSIDRQGYPVTSVNEKSLCGQSRLGYAFTRAFMVTGDESYLNDAHHALKFLYDHGWNNGWYMATDRAGNYISHWGHNDWWSFQQHYALLGIAAMVEATGGKTNWNDGSENDHTWLMRGVGSNYSRLWDTNQTTKGYFEKSNTTWTTKWGKGFTPTVDGITTHALLMALMYDSINHEQRLIELADNITDKIVSNMAISKAAFPENYHSDWTIDYGATSTSIGHAYKTSWVLSRIYLLNPSRVQYRNAALAIMQNLWDNGAYDTVYGGPFSSLYWQSGVIDNTNKNHWMLEQGITSGLINYYIAQTQAQRDMCLRVADGSLNFFMNHMMDKVYGESFTDVSRDGSSVVNSDKGGLFTAGYHSVELAYYSYLYSSLYYHHSPVQLYYKFPAENTDRTVKLTPLAIEDTALKIIQVTLDGFAYSDFNGATRTIHLPPQTSGKFKVTFSLDTVAPSPGVLRFSSATYSVSENSGAVTLTVNRVNGSDGTVTVNYATTNGTALSGNDYTAGSGTLTFADGVASQTITVPIINDAITESDETFTVALSGVTGGATISSPSSTSIMIADNDTSKPGILRFSSATYSIAENSSNVILTVNRENGSDGLVSVNYATANGTAIAGNDYSNNNGTLTFTNGITSQTIVLTINDDVISESNETFTVALSGVTGGATIGSPSNATVTITDNDSLVITLPGRVQAEDYKTGGEGVGYHDLTNGNSGSAYRTDNVDIQNAYDTGGGYNVGWTSGGEWLAFDVNVATTGLYDLTARMASATSGTKTMTITLDGATIGTFSTTDASGWQIWKNVVVKGVNLTAGTHALRMNMTTGGFNLNYLDVTAQTPEPGALQFSSSTYSVNENSGTITLTVNRINGSEGSVSANYTTTNGTAIAPGDYTAKSGTLTFANGITSQTIIISITDDITSENNETFSVNLNGTTGGTTIVSPSNAIITITDNDGSFITLPGRVQAENYRAGGEGVGYHDLTSGNSGNTYRTDNVDIENANDVGGGYNVGWISGDEWLSFDVNVTTTGLYDLTARIASANSGTKTMTVTLDGATIGTFSTTDASGWQSWKNVVVKGVNLTAGTHALRMNMTTGGFNLNYLDVTAQAPEPGTLQFSSSAYSVNENGGAITLTVNRINGSNGSVSVNYTTVNGTAVTPGDYTTNSGTLTFADGVTSQTISVSITDDAAIEGNEAFSISLTGVTGGATIGSQSSTIITIIDNDQIVDLALGKTATSSSNESSSTTAPNVVDGNSTTRWSSQYSNPQWIMIDLGATHSIRRVVLNWEYASAKDYRVEISSDGSNWTTMVTKSNMANGARIDNLTGLDVTGRYIRMYGTARTTQWGYSLWSFEVFAN